MIETVAT